MGGNDALTVIRPGALARLPASRETALVLTGIATGESDEPVSPMDDRLPVAAWRLGPRTTRLDIEFVAPHYLGASRLRYRHRLVGVDADWVLASSAEGRASYSRLPPGRYRFEAQVQGRDGDWAGTLAFDLVRAPTWHEETVFRFVIGLLAVALVLLAIRARLVMLRQRAATLEQMVQARTAALAQANAELAQAHRAVEEASLTDPLTGLHNRRFLWRHVDADVALALRSRFGGEAPREPGDLVFFLVDVDHFKRINDQHGHAVGDEVLVEMGRRLRAVFRESDHVVRWGGEEFLGVARGAAREDGARVAERLRVAVAGTPFVLSSGKALAVSCSVGYAALPLVAAHRHALGWEDTVAIADEALYQAKAAGRDGWAGFEESGEPVDPLELTALRLRSASAMAVRGLSLRRSRG
jgi:diguanylate cyclase (GGDEF)-like protein